jgi:arylsulfatase A-like enzyme
MTREVMREFKPRLLLVNFWDMDVAHWGSYSLYLQAITKTDRLCGMLWDEINANPAYKNKTTLLILPELGRDGDQNTANGFLNHRSGDPSCRKAWLLALGAGVQKGQSDRLVSHVDLLPTTAELLGIKTPPAAGRLLKEIL